MPNLRSFTDGETTYYELYITCPVCFNRGNLRPQSYWTHGDDDCDGRIYIGDNAHYYCIKCREHSHVSGWRYKCPGHSKESKENEEYIAVTAGELAAVVGLAAQAAGSAGAAWLKRFLDNLDD